MFLLYGSCVCVMGCMRGELHGVCMLVLGLLTYSSGALHTSHLGPEMTGRYVIAPFLVISDSELRWVVHAGGVAWVFACACACGGGATNPLQRALHIAFRTRNDRPLRHCAVPSHFGIRVCDG